MRRGTVLMVAAILALTVAGCSGGAGATVTQERASSKFVVLGAAATTSSPPTDMPGLAANSVPREALKGIPGAGEIVMASGTPEVSREQAIEKSRPDNGRLVSAVDVVLPVKVMRVALNDPKQAKPTRAWIVTWSGVTLTPTGGAGMKLKTVLDGRVVSFIDAKTGEELMRTESGGRP